MPTPVAPYGLQPRNCQRPPRTWRINRAHPLAHGLTACVVVNQSSGQLVELVRGQVSTGATVTPKGDEAQGALWASRGEVAPSPPMSALCRFRETLLGGFTEQWACYTYADESTNAGWNIQSRPSFGTGLTVSTFNNNGFGTYLLQTSVTSQAIAQWDVGFSINGSTARQLYLNGVPDTSDANGAMAAPAAATSLGPVNTSASLLGFGYAWNRVVTPTEFAWLYADPYAFLVPPAPAVLYFDFVAGTIAKTGTAYATVGAVMLDSGAKSITAAARAETGATARDTSAKGALGQSAGQTGTTARDSMAKGAIGATRASTAATVLTTAKKAITGATRWALGVLGFAHPSVIVRDIDYIVGAPTVSWYAGAVEAGWEAGTTITSWRAGAPTA